MSLLIYIAAPYTAPDPIANAREAVLVADRIYEASNHELVPLVPHCNLVWNFVVPHDVEHYYAYDMELLKRCDALLRIPGESWGADEEVKFAEANNIPVFYGEDDLFDWAEDEGLVS